MEQRNIDRQPAEFAASCASMGRSVGSDLLNISANGCLVLTAEPWLTEGNPVRVKIAGISSLDGKVVWAEGVRAGISFCTALHPAVVEYIALKAAVGPPADQALAG